MPNHVTNILTVKGTTKQLKEALSLLLDEEGNVDFNQALPIPKELEGTQHPTRIISFSDYQVQEVKIASGENVFSRGITGKKSKELIEEFGYDNWYDWQVNAWGTKWDAYEQKALTENTFQFDTAWSTPSRFLENFSKLFPEIVFEMKYADEDLGYNVGEYHLKDGEYVFINQPNGGSIEAFKIAVDLKGGSDSWIVNDLLVDGILEEELINVIEDVKNGNYETFESIAVGLAYIYKKSNKAYPAIIKEFLLGKAVLDEDYNYAGLILNSINNELVNTYKNVKVVDFEKYVLQFMTIEKLKKFEINLSRLLKLQKLIIELCSKAENNGHDIFEKIFNTQEVIKKIKSNLLKVKEVLITKQFIIE